MIKKIFTLAESTAWLSLRLAQQISEKDLKREAAEGRLPVCFDYRGNVAIYSRSGEEPNSSWIFPKLISKHYFVGILRSKSPVQLDCYCETWQKKQGFGGQPSMMQSGHYEDILSPNHVEVSTLTSIAPPLLRVEEHQYMARCDEHGVPQRSHIPQGKWIFHLDDLLALVANQGNPSAPTRAQQSDEASPHYAAVDSASKLSSAAQPDKYPDDDALKLASRERQIRRIEWAAAQHGFTPMAVATGGKSTLREFCMKTFPTFFQSRESFNNAWGKAVRESRVRMKDHEKFRVPDKTVRHTANR